MTEFLQWVFGDFYGNMLGLLINATQWTIYLSLTAFIGGGLIGLLFTVLKIVPVRWVQYVATGYIWIFQSIPLLMLLFLIGLGFPTFFQIDIPPWLAAGISLTLFTSAYMSEVWRGALQSVPVGQWEGGKALGLTFTQILSSIVAPQALRIATPPTVGFMVQVIKGTSMAYIIDYNDLMRWGKKIANSQ
jgi:polar amino acid transport system permease protein